MTIYKLVTIILSFTLVMIKKNKTKYFKTSVFECKYFLNFKKMKNKNILLVVTILLSLKNNYIICSNNDREAFCSTEGISN